MQLCGVGTVDIEGQRVGSCPGGGALETVLHTHLLHALELAVEVSDFQFQVASVASERLDVEHRIADDEVDRR